MRFQEGPAGTNGETGVDVTRVLVSTARAQAPKSPGEACLVHIYPSGPTMGSRFLLVNGPVTIGREDDCQIQIPDASVSRRHARIQRLGLDHHIVDLQSTNGTYVNDVRVAEQQLQDGDYLHIGNCICRYLAGGNVEAQYHQEIHRLTIMDALTDVHNRRFLLEYLGHELASSVRYRRPLALVLIDVDRFKAVNDRLGHLGGDCTLRELAGCVKKATRQEDVFGRYGGEEFGVVMAETNRDQAMAYAEGVRQLVEAHPFRYESLSYQVTISLGVAAVSGAGWLTTREIIRLADDKLHQAKRRGRNRVEG